MGQILAIDYGKKNIGLALSDETRQFASILPVLKIKYQKEAIEGLEQIIGSIGNIDQLVLGIPLGFNFKPTEMSKEIQEFAAKLKEQEFAKNLSIVFTNEIYSSQQAEKGKSKKFKQEKAHSEAARIFLQEYLDHINTKKPSAEN